MKQKRMQNKVEESDIRKSKNPASNILHERNNDSWDKLMVIRKNLGKKKKSKNTSAEILSEMRR
jgi:hypothetical protein